jgi:hypothetical protein
LINFFSPIKTVSLPIWCREKFWIGTKEELFVAEICSTHSTKGKLNVPCLNLGFRRLLKGGFSWLLVLFLHIRNTTRTIFHLWGNGSHYPDWKWVSEPLVVGLYVSLLSFPVFYRPFSFSFSLQHPTQPAPTPSGVFWAQLHIQLR